MKRHRILILGGGFGGVYAARRLEQLFPRRAGVEITLLSDENFLLFTPMLPEVVSSSIEAEHIVSPLRAFFRRVKVQNSQVTSIDLEKRVVVASHCAKCGAHELGFDHLVLALGSTTHFHGLPGAAEYAEPMKTLSDAMALRNHVIDLFEHADMEADPAVLRSMLTFVEPGAASLAPRRPRSFMTLPRLPVGSTPVFSPTTCESSWSTLAPASCLKSARSWLTTH